MSLVLNESLVLAKTRCQDLKSVLKLNCWGSGIKDVSLIRQLVNVEVVGLSCNEITTLEDFAHCTKLRELILRKNKIQDIGEIGHLQRLPNLTNLWLEENPCAENTPLYRKFVLKALPQLTVLDNKPVTREELHEIENRVASDIYEEILDSCASSGGSGPSSGGQQSAANDQFETNQENHNSNNNNNNQDNNTAYASQQQANQYQEQHSINETSYYQPTHQLNDTMNETTNSVNQLGLNDSVMLKSRQNHLHQARCLSSQGSMNGLNQNQSWQGSNTNNNNNNNMNMLPKGGKSRNGNILSAVLCLVKELDYVSCEVVQTALHCRMEETSQ